MKTKFIALFLLLIFILSCQNGVDNTNKNIETTKDNEIMIESAIETRVTDSLPDDLDFKGEIINIFHFGFSDVIKFDAIGEMGGDVVLDAVYQRNLNTEERLNVKLNWIEGSDDWDQFPTQIRTALLAGVEDYDIIMEENSRVFQQSLYGYFIDLMKAPYLELEKPYWFNDMMDSCSIDNSKRYFLTGSLNMSTLLGASTLYFNKSIFIDYFDDINAIYDHVLNWTWTHDVFAEYCKGVYTDINGNGEAEVGDMFGFESEAYVMPNYTSMSTGIHYSKRDTDGYPVLDFYNEQVVLWAETLYKLLFTDNISIVGTASTSFLNEKNLFLIRTLSTANSIRNATFEFGILPYPKLTESLDYMSGAATVNGTGVAIPVSAPAYKIDASCAVLESLCADAYRNVVPAWYEIALKIKYADADIDAQMVDIIYDHLYAPLIMIADKEIQTGSIFQYAVVQTKSSDFASYYAKNENSIMTKWNKMIDMYLSLEN